MSQTIVPHLWFDKEAKEAAEFYTKAFADGKITNVRTITGTPSGDCDIVSFSIMGHDFMGISAGPFFTKNPSISFFVNFDPSQNEKAREEQDALWGKLIEGGKILMPLQEYPFSKYYGWVEDRFGVSWQLIFTNPEGEPRPRIAPSLLFTGSVAGKAEEASDYYMSVFKDSKRGTVARYPKGMEPDKEGTMMFTDFQLLGQWFAAMDSAHPHAFAFNEGISFIVTCDTQEEIDHYWEKLSKVKEAEQCGWCKDAYGVSWQITPRIMNEMMSTGTKEQMERVTQAFLQMKKFDIAKLQEAFRGK
jgi:predicted 3-demethylubiquinone-9 3-methyltransferase (glyoxalase superfamily)